jgi:Putative Flp pilus-assembly TadE/G-like
MSLVFVGLGFMAMFAATTLAIDVGELMTARTQAQTSADAGALAGATALALNSYTDRSATGPAVTSAINTAKTNVVMGQAPSVTPPDVTFPLDPTTGQNDRISVTVYRTQARGNAVGTLIGRVFGVATSDISATAVAATLYANDMGCVLPLTIPDRWTEKQTGPWDPTDTFDMYDSKGNLLSNPDVYVPPGDVPPGDPLPTGYSYADTGLELVLKANNGSKVAPSLYNPWDLPGSVGGDDYRDNISGCNANMVETGQMMAPENGNMTGPTKQGTDGLVALDPNAYWDTGCNCVKGSDTIKYPNGSPRIRAVPLYNPVVYAKGQQSGKSGPQLEVVNYLGFFIESATGGGDVTGRITPILGHWNKNGPSATGGFARVVMLAQ